MTVGDIKVLNANQAEFDGKYNKNENELHQSSGKIQLSKLYAEDGTGHRAGDVQPAMGYTTGTYPSGDLKGQQRKWDNNATVEFKSGEAVVVYNNQGTRVFFKLKKPIAEPAAE